MTWPEQFREHLDDNKQRILEWRAWRRMVSMNTNDLVCVRRCTFEGPFIWVISRFALESESRFTLPSFSISLDPDQYGGYFEQIRAINRHREAFGLPEISRESL